MAFRNNLDGDPNLAQPEPKKQISRKACPERSRRVAKALSFSLLFSLCGSAPLCETFSCPASKDTIDKAPLFPLRVFVFLHAFVAKAY